MATYFTTADVLNAIGDGHVTVDQLADHFGVPAASYNLRADLRNLTAAGCLTAAGPDGARVFTVADPDLSRLPTDDYR
ncbi:hypothetical protein [Micromonospora sp. NPDC050695]|uniref:hypothetical protein n=1 Tax=Micromonospora sp. NPDC050695 TaxID=3154938 RepID=UPI0033D177B9